MRSFFIQGNPVAVARKKHAGVIRWTTVLHLLRDGEAWPITVIVFTLQIKFKKSTILWSQLKVLDVDPEWIAELWHNPVGEISMHCWHYSQKECPTSHHTVARIHKLSITDSFSKKCTGKWTLLVSSLEHTVEGVTMNLLQFGGSFFFLL